MDFSDYFGGRSYYYHFWIKQYKMRNTLTVGDKGFCSNSEILLKDIANNTREHDAWHLRGMSIENPLRGIKILAATQNSFIIDMPIDIDEDKVIAFVRIMKSLVNNYGKDTTVINGMTVPNEAHLTVISEYLRLEKKTIESNPRATFRAEQWGSRAVGLWLWDHVHEHGGRDKRGTIAAAIRTLYESFSAELNQLGCVKSDSRTIRSFYEKTASCIEECEVLSFK